MKNKLIILGIIVVLIALASGYCLRNKSNKSLERVRQETVNTENESQNNKTQQQNSATTETSLAPAFVPEGWKTYSNNEWKIAFAYPGGGEIEEAGSTKEIRANPEKGERLTSQELKGIWLKEDSYSIVISRTASGLPDYEYIHPKYIISGYDTRTWETNLDDGFRLYISLYPACGGINFSIRNEKSKSKDLIDKILSTIICR